MTNEEIFTFEHLYEAYLHCRKSKQHKGEVIRFEIDLAAGKFIGKDVEHILELSIGSKLREEWAREFIDFYNIPTLSVDEVIHEQYSQADLPCDINERFACVMSLLFASEREVETCRTFIREHCDPEYLQVYDLYWVGNDPRRMELINELQEMTMIDEGVGKGR